MRFTLNLKNEGYIEFYGQQGVKYWAGWGLPTFEGDLEGLDLAHPDIMQELIDMKVIARD